MKLKDKVAIITGAGRGIGRAYALRFAAEGAKIVIAEIDFRNAQAVAQQISAQGQEAFALNTDVSDEKSTQQMAEETVKRFGRIDILVNNAAIYYGITMKPFSAITVEEWDRLMAVNVKGSWLCVKAVLPQMKAQGRGKIINIASQTILLGTPMLLHYVTSKGAILAMTRAMARELGDYGINVNCLCPGFTMSESSQELCRSVEGLAEMVASMQCFKRSEQPEDLVGVCVFLASEDSDFMTGQMIVVDGGAAMY